MTEVTSIKKTPLPATVEDMLARKSPTLQNLNDHVDSIHVTLFATDPEYRELLDATHDEEAVEGSLAADNFEAAGKIREYARKHDDAYVGKKKKATIIKSLNVVLRRYHMSRKERAASVGGEPVPNGE